MIFHPPILALLGASWLAVTVLAAAAVFAVRLLRHWDREAGSERQIGLERATILVSTVVALVLALEAASLVLFVFAADRMAALFVGAMCAVGTLQANPWGFPTLFAKIAVFFAAGLWLVLDRVDGAGRDWPFVRAKYAALLALAPIVAVEAVLETVYFAGLRADTLTSCCGRLFEDGEQASGAGGELAGLAPGPALALLFGAVAVALLTGLAAGRFRPARLLHGLASAATFGAGLAGVVSVVSLYVYEQPHHHCPFCLLKPEYGHFGFALYLPLFVGTAAGLATGLLGLLPDRPSLEEALPATARRLARVSVVGFGLFALACLWAIGRSNLVLFG
jgi:hypothetical protein